MISNIVKNDKIVGYIVSGQPTLRDAAAELIENCTDGDIYAEAVDTLARLGGGASMLPMDGHDCWRFDLTDAELLGICHEAAKNAYSGSAINNKLLFFVLLGLVATSLLFAVFLMI